MLELRPFDRLGRFENGWLDAHYHFSFADYLDMERMGVGKLRVWNDDTFRPGNGFPPHGHRDMEIITYVREGVLTHEDSLGNVGRTAAGQVQVMSAGTGIRHSEVNKGVEPVRLFQIWIEPNRTGLPPRWETRPFPRTHGRLEILASGREDDGDVPHIFQDARVVGGTLDHGQSVTYRPLHKHVYLVPARGSIEVDGQPVLERSGLLASDVEALRIVATADSEVVLVDVA